MSQSFLNGRVILHAGDCREVIKGIADASIDAAVMDPPYALVSIGKRFGKPGAAPAAHGRDGLYARASVGFMGQGWDTGETAFDPAFWAQVLRVLKPGSHLVAFSGTRTYHRMACAIEDAGFEIRDQLAWTYGSGFPKSHNQGDGWGTALKPAWEPIVLARKPLVGTVSANVLEHGTGALNIDGCRIEGGSTLRLKAGGKSDFPHEDDSWTPKSVMVGSDAGRWPANIIHDGSDEVVGAFPAAPGQQRTSRDDQRSQGSVYGAISKKGTREHAPRNDAGSAARFFYSAKADADDRLGSKHPTVKPVDLMQWLCRLVTPPGGTVLDAFAGTGTTGEAAWREGLSAVLIEREEAYRADIARRMALAESGPATRKAESNKARHGQVHAGPLFGSEAAE